MIFNVSQAFSFNAGITFYIHLNVDALLKVNIRI